MSQNFANHSLLAGEFGLVGMGVERNFIAYWSAQQLVNWLTEDFAPDVPEGYIDGAHAFDGGAAAAHVGEASENLVPEMLDTCGVLACHDDANLPQDRAESAVRKLCSGGDLSPATRALVSHHLDEQELAPIRSLGLDQPRPNARDFHLNYLCLKCQANDVRDWTGRSIRPERRCARASVREYAGRNPRHGGKRVRPPCRLLPPLRAR